MAEKEFDVVVIGAGSTGEVAAGRIADNSDLSVAIIEQHLVGGECSFYACMPSKALLRPAEILAEIKRVPGAAEAVTGDLDVAAVLARRDEVIADLDDAGQVPWLESRRIELFRGKGRLAGERRVSVGDDVLVARKAVILAPGSGPAMPPIDGLSEVAAWSNREITVAKEVPKHLIVLGGGVVGVEMAQAWSSLGANVSIVEAQDRLLPLTGGFEPFAGQELADGLREHGVDLHLGATAVKAKRDGDIVTLILTGDKLHEGEHEIEGDHLLVATGRTPQTNDFGLETVGMEPGGWIEVDERLRVGDRDWLYAPGDVNGRALLTHMGKYQGRIAGDNIMGIDATIEADGDQSPSIVFTNPPGRVGRPHAGLGNGSRDQRNRHRCPELRQRRGQLSRPQYARHLADRRRRGSQGDGRRDVRRPGDRGVAARRNDRRRRGGPDGQALACGALFPESQRGLAEADGGLRPLVKPPSCGRRRRPVARRPRRLRSRAR